MNYKSDNRKHVVDCVCFQPILIIKIKKRLLFYRLHCSANVLSYFILDPPVIHLFLSPINSPPFSDPSSWLDQDISGLPDSILEFDLENFGLDSNLGWPWMCHKSTQKHPYCDTFIWTSTFLKECFCQWTRHIVLRVK